MLSRVITLVPPQRRPYISAQQEIENITEKGL
jgi:hypothetical protein